MWSVVVVAISGSLVLACPAAHAAAEVRVQAGSFVYTMRPDGMTAESWVNRAAGTRLSLGHGSELEVETGDSPESPTRVVLEPDGAPEVARDGGMVVVRLRSADGLLAAAVTYVADAEWPVMRKSVTLSNVGKAPIRLLSVVLGRYAVGNAQLEGGERGFPLYIDQRYFLSLAHPAGFAHAEGREMVLRQYPGATPPSRSPR